MNPLTLKVNLSNGVRDVCIASADDAAQKWVWQTHEPQSRRNAKRAQKRYEKGALGMAITTATLEHFFRSDMPMRSNAVKRQLLELVVHQHCFVVVAGCKLANAHHLNS